MSELKKQSGYIHDMIEMTEALERITATFDQRVVDMKGIIRQCDEQLADILHFSEYFADRNPQSEEFEAIGREVARLRTERRDAKKALYVLESNARVSKGMLPALQHADKHLSKPSPIGNPTYVQYRVRNSESVAFIKDKLPSFDMEQPVHINVPSSFAKVDEEPEAPSLYEEIGKEVEEARAIEPTKEPQPVEKLAKVRKQGASFVVLNGIDPVFRSTKFMDLVNYLMDDHQCGVCRFDQKSYQSLETFAKSYRSGKQRGADHVNHKDFEKLYANSYFEA